MSRRPHMMPHNVMPLHLQQQQQRAMNVANLQHGMQPPAGPMFSSPFLSNKALTTGTVSAVAMAMHGGGGGRPQYTNHHGHRGMPPPRPHFRPRNRHPLAPPPPRRAIEPCTKPGSPFAMLNIHPLYKTRLCRHFENGGYCAWGDLCRFAHGRHDLRRPGETVTDYAHRTGRDPVDLFKSLAMAAPTMERTEQGSVRAVAKIGTTGMEAVIPGAHRPQPKWKLQQAAMQQQAAQQALLQGQAPLQPGQAPPVNVSPGSGGSSARRVTAEEVKQAQIRAQEVQRLYLQQAAEEEERKKLQQASSVTMSCPTMPRRLTQQQKDIVDQIVAEQQQNGTSVPSSPQQPQQANNSQVVAGEANKATGTDDADLVSPATSVGSLSSRGSVPDLSSSRTTTAGSSRKNSLSPDIGQHIAHHFRQLNLEVNQSTAASSTAGIAAVDHQNGSQTVVG